MSQKCFVFFYDMFQLRTGYRYMKYFLLLPQVWDMRTKACIHTLTGHTSTVAVVRSQAAEPQVM